MLASTPTLAAAAAGPETAPPPVASSEAPYDPWQSVNRGSFALSMAIDRVLIGPITHIYMRVTPQVIRNRISSAVYNLGEPGTAINDVAQGHPKRASKATARFVINSTVGIAGLFDVATGMGIPSHDADFGQTLGRYGAQAGPYMYMPLVGPLNLRDGVGRIVDLFADPISLFTGGIDTPFGGARLAATTVDTRALGDPAFKALEDATDPYATTRSAYTQHRAFMVQKATGEAVELPDFDAPPSAPGPSDASSSASASVAEDSPDPASPASPPPQISPPDPVSSASPPVSASPPQG